MIGRLDVYQAAAPLQTNQSGRLASFRFLLADRVIYVPTRPVWQVVKRVVDTRHNDACHKATRPHLRLASIKVINSALHFVSLTTTYRINTEDQHNNSSSSHAAVSTPLTCICTCCSDLHIMWRQPVVLSTKTMSAL